MKTRSGCAKPGVAMAFLFSALALAVLLALVLFADYSTFRQRRINEQNAPPIVQVTSPAPGASAPVESYFSVSATAMGMNPIVRAELWLDGELKETQDSDQADGTSPFYADFGLFLLSEGPHMLFVRAVDANGIIGQSPPLILVGEPKSSESFLAVTAQEGESLEDIANAHDIDLETVQTLNPGVEDQPPSGTVIKIPLQIEEEQPPSSAEPPAPGNPTLEIPNVPMLQIYADRSIELPGSNPAGFLPEYTTTPPTAPTNLQAEAKNCKITLRWNDNSDTELYLVYIVAPNAENYTNTAFPIPYAFLNGFKGKGPVWYEFQPPVGGVVSLWVSAANADGMQPSNIVWVYIPYITGCPPITATDLKITLHDFTAGGNYDEAYCYVSFEDKPEHRVPPTDGIFIQLQGGKSAGSFLDSFSIPVPSDLAIDIGGKCLGWAGGSLSELGPFSANLTQETWNGDKQILQGNSYQIAISVKPETSWYLLQNGSTNPTLPAPYDLREDPPPNEPWTASYYPPARLLRWKWDGDPGKADAFIIFLNGKPYDYLSPKYSEKVVQLPGECDASVRWQVAVRTVSGLSNLSPPVQYDLPPCQVYLRVRFDNINLQRTDDGWPSGPGACDSLEAYFQISVRDVTRSFWGGNFFIPLDCRMKYFSTITGGPYKQLYVPEPNVITIPLAPGEELGGIWIRARFWDHDDNPDDLFATFAEHPWGAYLPPPGEKWDQCFLTYTTGKSITSDATSTLTFSLSVYPNACRDTPPAEGF